MFFKRIERNSHFYDDILVAVTSTLFNGLPNNGYHVIFSEAKLQIEVAHKIEYETSPELHESFRVWDQFDLGNFKC